MLDTLPERLVLAKLLELRVRTPQATAKWLLRNYQDNHDRNQAT